MVEVPRLTRRYPLTMSGSAAIAACPWRRVSALAGRHIAPEPGLVRLVGSKHPQTGVWAHDGQVPGPKRRVRQGELLRVAAEQRLDDETAVPWHGAQMPEAMDGVPHPIREPTAPGETAP